MKTSLNRIEEAPTRSGVKSLSYCVLGTLVTMLVVWLKTGEWSMTVGAGIMDFFAKMILFYTHERVWNQILWGKRELTPAVIWFTGLCGAGKTTLSERLLALMEKNALSVDLLDGDSVRSFFKDTGFTRSERIRHLTSMGFIAAKLERNGTFVLASFITPYEEARDQIRSQCSNFIEVYVGTPLDVCEKRDPKGLYKRARSGEIKNFTGISDDFEVPHRSEIILDTSHQSIDQAFEELIFKLKEKIPNLKGLRS